MLKVIIPVDEPLGARMCQAIDTGDGAMYQAIYRYEQRGAQWVAVLDRLVEKMPPTPPQARRFDDQCRLPMMRPDGSPDWEAEAAQRRKEWAEVNHVPA